MGVEINLFLTLTTAAGVSFYLISTILIFEFHKKRNDKTPGFLMVNLLIFHYVARYKQITKAESRHVGALFYLWLISIIAAFASLILLVLINIIVMRGA